MTIPQFPPPAARIVEAVARECEIDADEMFAADRLSPAAHVARQLAIQRLANLKIGDKYRYSIDEVRGWFGLSRPWVNAIRAKGASYRKRTNRTRRLA